MTHGHIFAWAWLLGAAWGCTHSPAPPPPPNAPGERYLYYQAKTQPHTAGGLAATVYLAGDKFTGRVFLAHCSGHQGSGQWERRPGMAELTTTNGLRSGAIAHTIAHGARRPNTIACDTLRFHPINDMALYRQVGFRGDLEQAYRVPLTYALPKDGGPWQPDTLRFSVSDADYQDYQAHFGREPSLVPFVFSFDKQGFARAQKHHMRTLLAAEGQDPAAVPKGGGHPVLPNTTIQATDQELLVQGIHIKCLAYASRDTLHIAIRVTNRGSFDLQARPRQIIVRDSHGGKTFAPALGPPANAGRDANPVILVRKGGRHGVALRYPLQSQALAGFSIDLGGIATASGQPLLAGPLAFSKPQTPATTY